MLYRGHHDRVAHECILDLRTSPTVAQKIDQAVSTTHKATVLTILMLRMRRCLPRQRPAAAKVSSFSRALASRLRLEPLHDAANSRRIGIS